MVVCVILRRTQKDKVKMDRSSLTRTPNHNIHNPAALPTFNYRHHEGRLCTAVDLPSWLSYNAG
jgi:hypothetical protein